MQCCGRAKKAKLIILVKQTNNFSLRKLGIAANPQNLDENRNLFMIKSFFRDRMKE